MIDFFSMAEEKYDMMVNLRRKLHMYPEVDRDLKGTVDAVETHLKELGIRYRRIGNKGIIGEIGNNDGKTIALRADMDALKVLDLKNVPYSSKKEGVMHACGHDAHTSILIGAGALLKSFEKDLKGTVRLIFQPAEETDGGAVDMIEEGCLKDVDGIIGLHVDENIDTGFVGAKRGTVCAASNPFEIRVFGKGAHGAAPDTGVDAILIAANIINNLQNIISREVSSLDNAVITIGTISGGTALNAISSSVVMEGILRTVGDDLRGFCKDRIRSVVENTSSMMRGRAEIDFVEGYPSFNNDEAILKLFTNLVSQTKNIQLVEIDKPAMGVEDFAYYARKVPGLYYRLGCRNKEKGIDNPAHGSYFDIDEKAMVIGCAMQAMLAYEYLK